MSTPFFIILINTRHSSWKLNRCLDSLLSQNFRDWEALVTDDCSSDDTPLVLRDFSSRDPRIKGFFNSIWRGALYNTIARLGPLRDNPVVVVLDGDDYLANEQSLRTIYEMYIKYPLTQISIGGHIKKKGSDEKVSITDFNSNSPLAHRSYFFSHCRTFRLASYKRIPLKYLEVKEENPQKTSVDIVIQSILILTSQHVCILQTPVYVWDVTHDSPHDSNYKADSFKNPIAERYKRKAKKVAYLLNKENPFTLTINHYSRSGSILLSEAVPSIQYTKTFLSCYLVYVIPVYNPGEKLARCLSSIAASSPGEGVGVLIYDDGSTRPNRQDILLQLTELGMPYCLMSNSVNKLKSHNLLQISRRIPLGKDCILAFLDGDDYLPPKRVGDTIAFHYLNKEIEATLGSYSLDPKGLPSPRLREASLVSPLHAPMDFNHVWDSSRCWTWYHLKTCKFHLLNKVEEEFFLEEDNSSFIKLGEDNFVFARCLEKAGGIKVIPEVLYIYDVGGNTCHEDSDQSSRYVYLLKKNKEFFFPRRGCAPISTSSHILAKISLRMTKGSL